MSQSGKFTPSNPLDNGRVPVTPNDGRADPPEITTDCYAYPGTSGPLHAGDGSVAFRGLFDRDAASEQQAMPQPPKNNPFESRIIANFTPFIYDMHKYEEYEYEQMDGYIRVINKMFGADAENPKSFFPYWKDISDASVAQEGAFVGSCAVVVEGAAPGPVQGVHIVELHAHKFELVPGMPAPIDQFQYVHVLGGTESAYQEDFIAPAYTDDDTAYASMMDMSWLTLSDPMYTGLVGNIVLIDVMQGYGIIWSYRPGAAHAMDTHVETYLGMPHDYEGEPIYGNLTIIESVFTPPSWEEAVIWQDGRPYYVKYPFMQLYKSSHDFVGETTWEHWGAFASMVDVLATNNWDYTFEYGVFDGWIADTQHAVKDGAYNFAADISQDAKGFEPESVLTAVFTDDGIAWHAAWSRYADMPDTLTCTWEDVVLVPQANCDYGKLSNLVEYAPIMEGPSRKGDQAFRTDFSFFAGHTEAVTYTWDDQMRVIPQLNVDYYHCQIIDSPLLGESRNQLGPYFATFAFSADMNAVNVSYGDIDVSPVIPWPHDQVGMLESLSFAIVPYIQDNADLYADMCNAMYTADMPDMGWTIETNQFSAEEVLLLMPDNRKLGYDQVLPYTADEIPGLEWARSEDQVHGNRVDARMFVDDNTRLTLTYDGTFMIVYHDAYQPTLLNTTWDETKYVIPHDPNVQLGYARQLQEISMAPILDPFGNRNDWLVLPPLDGMEITWEQDNILTPQLNFDWKKTQDLESFKFAIELDKFSGFSFFLADETPGLEVTWEQDRILNPDNDFVNGHVVVLSEPGPVIQAMWSHFDSIVVGDAFTQDVLEWGMEEHAMSLGINKWFLFSGYEVWSYTAYLDNNLPFSYLKAFMKPALDPQEALSSHTAPMHMPSVGCHTEAHAVQGAGEFTFFPETTTVFDFLFVDGVIPVFADGLHIPSILHEPHAVYIWFASSLGRGYSTMSFGTQSVTTTVVCADADTILSGMAPNSPYLAWSDADITEYGIWGGSSVMPFDADMPTGILCDVGFFNRKPNDEFVNTAWVAEALVPPILLFDVLIFPADEIEAVLHDKGWLESTENVPSRNFVSVMTSLNGEFDFDNWPSFDADKAFTADAGVDNMYAPRVMDEKKAHGWWDAAKFTMDYPISFDWNVGDVWYTADRTGLRWNMSSQHTVAHGWWDTAEQSLDSPVSFGWNIMGVWYVAERSNDAFTNARAFDISYAHGWWDAAEQSLVSAIMFDWNVGDTWYAAAPDMIGIPADISVGGMALAVNMQAELTIIPSNIFDWNVSDVWYAPDAKPVDWNMGFANQHLVGHFETSEHPLFTLDPALYRIGIADIGRYAADPEPIDWNMGFANQHLVGHAVYELWPAWDFNHDTVWGGDELMVAEYLDLIKIREYVFNDQFSSPQLDIWRTDYRIGPDIALYRDLHYALLKQPYSIYKGIYGCDSIDHVNRAWEVSGAVGIFSCNYYSYMRFDAILTQDDGGAFVQSRMNFVPHLQNPTLPHFNLQTLFYNSHAYYLDNNIYGWVVYPDDRLPAEITVSNLAGAFDNAHDPYVRHGADNLVEYTDDKTRPEWVNKWFFHTAAEVVGLPFEFSLDPALIFSGAESVTTYTDDGLFGKYDLKRFDTTGWTVFVELLEHTLIPAVAFIGDPQEVPFAPDPQRVEYDMRRFDYTAWSMELYDAGLYLDFTTSFVSVISEVPYTAMEYSEYAIHSQQAAAYAALGETAVFVTDSALEHIADMTEIVFAADHRNDFDPARFDHTAAIVESMQAEIDYMNAMSFDWNVGDIWYTFEPKKMDWSKPAFGNSTAQLIGEIAEFTLVPALPFDWNVSDTWYAPDRDTLGWNMENQHRTAHGWWDAAKFTLDFALLREGIGADAWYAADHSELGWLLESQQAIAHAAIGLPFEFTLEPALLRDAFGVETYYAADYASLGKVMKNCFHYAHGWWDTAELSLDPMRILGADMVVSEYASGSVLNVPPILTTAIRTAHYEDHFEVALDLSKYFGIDGAGGDAWYAPDPKPVDWDMALADNNRAAYGWWDTAYLVTLTMRYVPGAESGVWCADSFPELNWDTSLANNHLTAEEVIGKAFEFTLEPALFRIGIEAPETHSYLYRDKNNDLVYFSHTSGGMVWVFKEYQLGPDIVLYQDSRYALLKQPYSIYKGVYGLWYVEYTNLAHAADTQLFSVYDCRDHSVVPRETDMLSNGTIDIVQHGPNLGIFPPTGNTKFRSGTPHFYNSQNFYLDNQIYGGPLDPDTLLAMGQEATVMLSPWNGDFSIIPIYATHAPEAYAKDGENNVVPDQRADMLTGYALDTLEHPFYSTQFNMLFDWNVSDVWYAKNGEHDITPDPRSGIVETYALTDTAFPLYTTDFNTSFDWNVSDAWFAGYNEVFTAPDPRSGAHIAFFDELKLAAYAPYTHCGEHSQPDLFGSVENQVSVGIWDSIYSGVHWNEESHQNAAYAVHGLPFEFTLAPALTFDWNMSDTWYTQSHPVLELDGMTGFATGAFAEAGNKLAMLDWFPDIMTFNATAAPAAHTADRVFDPGWADYPWVSAWASAEIEVMFHEAVGGHMPGTGADAWQTFDGDALTYPMWPLFQFAAHTADTILFSSEIDFTNGVLEGRLGDGDEVIINDAMCVHPAMEGFIELTGFIFGDFWLSTMQPISAEMSTVLSVTEEMVAAVYPDQHLAFYVSQEFPNILEVESTATEQPGAFIEISTFEEQQILPNWDIHLAMQMADHPYGYIDTLNKEIASQLAFVSYEMEPSVIGNIPAATDWEKYLKAYGSCAATATQYAGILVCKYIGCPYWAVIVDGVIVVQDPPFVYIPMIPEIELWFDYQTDSQLDMAFVF